MIHLWPAGRRFPKRTFLSPMGWLAIVASVATAFGLLITLPFAGFPLNLLPVIFYTGLPLLTLALVSKGHHTALFGRFGFKEAGLALGFGLLTIIASFAIGFILLQFVPMTANATAAGLADVGGFDIAAFLLRTLIQLIGEEVMTILPLLAVLWLCFHHSMCRVGSAWSSPSSSLPPGSRRYICRPMTGT